MMAKIEPKNQNLGKLTYFCGTVNYQNNYLVINFGSKDVLSRFQNKNVQ